MVIGYTSFCIIKVFLGFHNDFFIIHILPCPGGIVSKNILFESLLIKTFLFIMILGIVLFTLLIIVNKTLIFGWLYGSFISLLDYFISLFLFNKLFKNKKNKIQGFLIGAFKFYLNATMQVIFLIILIVVNKKINGYSLFDGPISTIYGPINLFTYLGGISILWISIFFTYSIYQKKG